MEIFWENFEYIALNSFLALVAVVFGWLMIKFKSLYLKLLFGFLWLIFLPNTIYILTDITHLFEAWPLVDNFSRLALLLQYSGFSLIGIVSFAISVYFFQVILEGKGSWKKKRLKSSSSVAIIILNFLVGFGVVLGGIQRTNSWEIFTNPSRVIEDVNTLITTQELLVLAFGIGLLSNLIYFIMLESVSTWGQKFFKKIAS